MLATRLQNLTLALAIVGLMSGSPVQAQWRLGIEVGAARFWGASRDTVDANSSVVPYRPTTFGVSLERQAGKYGFGVQLHYSEASLGLIGPELQVAAEGAFTVFSISPEAVVRLATLGAANELRLHAGPLFELWDLVDMDSRARVGAQGSVSLDVPLGGRFRGAVIAGGAVTPSPYNEGELDLEDGAPTYKLRTMWRRSFAVALDYEL
ncbi:MAG TPA: hypothetical protein VHH32_10375 [Gemmatimonadales bacterium]|nr:hypothetical protein [Gemmatimonadales bacterium]